MRATRRAGRNRDQSSRSRRTGHRRITGTLSAPERGSRASRASLRSPCSRWLVVAGGGGTPAEKQQLASAAAEAWVTTDDRAMLLAKGPNAPISVGEQTGVTTHIDVETAVTYQAMVRFGAAITDASASLIQTRLSRAQRNALLQDLFGPRRESGSASPHSPSARGTFHARITASTTWSAPAWMKTTGSLIKGALRPEVIRRSRSPCADTSRRTKPRACAVTHNEEYFALAHASRFVRPVARWIASSTAVDGLETVAFRNTDGSKVRAS